MINDKSQNALAQDCQKINFSIFGTTPEELAMTQHERYQNPALAARKLNALFSLTNGTNHNLAAVLAAI